MIEWLSNVFTFQQNKIVKKNAKKKHRTLALQYVIISAHVAVILIIDIRMVFHFLLVKQKIIPKSKA